MFIYGYIVVKIRRYTCCLYCNSAFVPTVIEMFVNWITYRQEKIYLTLLHPFEVHYFPGSGGVCDCVSHSHNFSVHFSRRMNYSPVFDRECYSRVKQLKLLLEKFPIYFEFNSTCRWIWKSQCSRVWLDIHIWKWKIHETRLDSLYLFSFFIVMIMFIVYDYPSFISFAIWLLNVNRITPSMYDVWMYIV